MEDEPRVPAEETPDEPRSWEVEQAPVPLIYVASLSDYNAGVLHGTWMEAAKGPDELQKAIDGMLIASPGGHAEEWAIHDYQGFGRLHLAEHEALEQVSRLANGIKTYGPAFGHWAAIKSDEAAEDPRRFEDQYEGHWPSLEAYGADRLEELGLEELLDRYLPESLRQYVRTQPFLFAEDMFLAGDIAVSEGDGGWYVFQGYD